MRGMLLLVLVVIALVAWYPSPVEAQCVGNACPVMTAPVADAGEYVAGQPVRTGLRAVALGMRAIVERRPVRRIGRAVFRPVRRAVGRLRRR